MHNCTLPVTSAEAERSFRCVKLIKTHLRTNLSLLSLHSDRVNALDLDRVIDMFAVLSYTALCLNFTHVEFRPCINRLTPKPVVHRLNVFILVAFEFLPYLEIKLTFECST